MNNIKVTFYQFASYFLSGIIVLISYFVYSENITNFKSLINRVNEFGTGIFILSTIFSFLIGMIINGLRNGIFEFLLIDLVLFGKVSEKINWDFLKSRREKLKINWDFFHTANSSELSKLEDNYYSVYCSSLNYIISLLLSYYFFLKSFHSPENSFIIVGIILVLIIYAIGLRLQIVKAINIRMKRDVSNGDKNITEQLKSTKRKLAEVETDLDKIIEFYKTDN